MTAVLTRTKHKITEMSVDDITPGLALQLSGLSFGTQGEMCDRLWRCRNQTDGSVGRVYVAYQKIPVGWALRWTDVESAGEWTVHLFVREDLRRTGIGTALVEKSCREGRSRKTIAIKGQPWNNASISFWESTGNPYEVIKV
jgi:GNAT superfamily N-acetyltransferase